jgi:hypothetical protein
MHIHTHTHTHTHTYIYIERSDHKFTVRFFYNFIYSIIIILYYFIILLKRTLECFICTIFCMLL